MTFDTSGQLDAQQLYKNAKKIASKHRQTPTNNTNMLHNTHASTWKEERENIVQFWNAMTAEKKRKLLTVDKHELLQKMKDKSKEHLCHCEACSRRRLFLDDELEMVFDNFYQTLAYSYRPLDIPEDQRDIEEDCNVVDDLVNPNHFTHDSESWEELEAHFDFTLAPLGEFKLTVCKELLENDSKRLMLMMEHLSLQDVIDFEDDDNSDSYVDSDNSKSEDFDDFSDEEYAFSDLDDDDDDDCDRECDHESTSSTTEERMEESRRMFQIFAAKIFEERLIQSYLEKVAADNQEKFLRELAEEEERERQQELKKKMKRASQKERKKLEKQQKEAERLKKEKEKQEAEEEERRRKKLEEEAKREKLKLESERKRAAEEKKEAERREMERKQSELLLKQQQQQLAKKAKKAKKKSAEKKNDAFVEAEDDKKEQKVFSQTIPNYITTEATVSVSPPPGFCSMQPPPMPMIYPQPPPPPVNVGATTNSKIPQPIGPIGSRIPSAAMPPGSFKVESGLVPIIGPSLINRSPLFNSQIPPQHAAPSYNQFYSLSPEHSSRFDQLSTSSLFANSSSPWSNKNSQ